MRGRTDNSAGDPVPASGTGSAAGGLRINVLGQLTASRQRPVDLGGRRQRAVLALLVIARGDAVPTERLISSLWGERPSSGAIGALHAYISHLRRRLEPERTARSRGMVIVSRGAAYALDIAADAVDAWQFERLVRQAPVADPAVAETRLAEALALWRGPAFAEYAGEQWAQPEAHRLGELREVAREQLLAARLARGEAAVLVPEIEALVGEQPLREERWRLLVLALYRSHRQADALAALRRVRQVLADELGVDPGPALRSLEVEVLAQSPDLAAPAAGRSSAGLPSAGPAAGPAAGLPSAGPDLVDRHRELAELRDCVTDVAAGQARLVLLEGPAGIGKTRMLREARRLAAELGVRVLTARGSQLEKEYAFGAVRQLFEPVVGPSGDRAALTGAAASAGMVFDIATAAPQPRADASLAVLHGLYWLTVNLTGAGPVMLALDDLQLCDSASLRFLSYLVRRLDGLPLLLVGTLRTGEPHADEALLAELVHDPGASSIRLGPLTAAGVADLVRGRLGQADDSFVTACYRSTSGNPLFVRQLLRALQSEGVRPDAAYADTVTAIGARAITSQVLMRLARLPAAATAVARAVAVLGGGAALPAVAELAGLSDEQAAGAVAALARVEVLRDEYPLAFVHPLVADAVYRDVPPGERQICHERAAHVLDRSGAAAEQVAAHLLHAPHRGEAWAVEVLSQAADRARERGAPDASVAYLRRALSEPPVPAVRPHVLLSLGQVETFGDGSAAVRHLREAYASLADPELRASVALTLALTLVFAGATGEATRFAQRAQAELPAELTDQRQGLLGLERISGYMYDQDPRPGVDLTLDGDGPGARMLAAAMAWEAFLDGADRQRAVALARFAMADGVLVEADIGLLWVAATMVLQHADEDTRPIWDALLATAHRQGAMFSALAVHLWRGHGEWQRGELREAYQSFSNSNEQFRAWGTRLGTSYGEAFIVGVLLDQGDVAGARAYLDANRHALRITDGLRLFIEMEAEVLMAEGRYAAALSRLDSTAGLMVRVANPVWRPWRSRRARALAGLGRRGEAVPLVERELELARAWGTPSLAGRTLRVLGELRGADGVDELREAVELLSSGDARLELARARYALARHARPGEAAALLREAYLAADACGAAGLCRLVAAALGRAGVEPPRQPSAATLTTTERRIVARYVNGADAREIAEEFFLTPRLVQTTLDAVRNRLAAGSRADLRAAVAS